MPSEVKNQSYVTHIDKVLKNVLSPELSLTGDGKDSINNIVMFLLNRLMVHINTLLMTTKKKTITTRDVSTAVCLEFPTDVATRVTKRANKAVAAYKKSLKAEGKKKGDQKSVTKSVRAGLLFPVKRTLNLMAARSLVYRKSDSSAVFMSAILEAVTSDILTHAGSVAKQNKKARINPRHILLGVNQDPMLADVLSDVVLSGGVIPSRKD